MGWRSGWHGRGLAASRRLPRGGRVLILVDSKAAIAAVKRQAGGGEAGVDEDSHWHPWE